MKTYFKGILSAGLAMILLSGCGNFAHYQVNEPLEKFRPDYGYIAQNLGPVGHSDELLLILSFSGGGTRAASFSYGALEELRETVVTLGGQKRRLLDEVDMISGVSGGSFTAAYFGLFGDRIFEDYPSRFLKKDIQSKITSLVLFNPVNWFRLSSPFFSRSDLAAEYYDQHVFDGKTYQDMLERKGPVILINTTEMAHGARFTFHQITFNIMCSDLLKFPVARACAASSAVPGIFAPLTLKNYAGTCGYNIQPHLEETKQNYRLRETSDNAALLMNAKKKTYLHLIDGGVADNLGLRAIEESVDTFGDIWRVMKMTGREKVRKVVFVVVNAETKVESSWDTIEIIPPLVAMVSNYSTIAIVRYNRETMAVLQESFGRWTHQIRKGRCPEGQINTQRGACGDIEFYLVDVRFENMMDQKEGNYLSGLPTSFRLPDSDVDRLRSGARKILSESPEFQKFLRDLNAER